MDDLWRGLQCDAYHTTTTGSSCNDNGVDQQCMMMFSLSHENDLSNEQQQQQKQKQKQKQSSVVDIKDHPEQEETTKDSGPWNQSETVPMEAAPNKKSRINKRGRGPKFVFKTRSEKDVMDDGYKWRKYGKKPVKSSPYPRNYYKCLDTNCTVRKRIERDPTDGNIVITTYEGTHNHERPCVVYYYVTGAEVY